MSFPTLAINANSKKSKKNRQRKKKNQIKDTCGVEEAVFQESTKDVFKSQKEDRVQNNYDLNPTKKETLREEEKVFQERIKDETQINTSTQGIQRPNSERKEETKVQEHSFNDDVLLKNKEPKLSSSQKILSELLTKKFEYVSHDLNDYLLKVDKDALKSITKEDIIAFCESSKINKQYEEHITCRLYIPEKDDIDMAEVLIYNAYYPWEIEEENRFMFTYVVLSIQEQLAYAAFYGHPQAPPEFLYFIKIQRKFVKDCPELLKRVENLVQQAKTERFEEHIYYIKWSHTNRDDEIPTGYWWKTREFLKKLATHLLNIIKKGSSDIEIEADPDNY